MKDHVRDNILNMITPFTREKIHQLTLYHFRLLDKHESNFLTLLDIFTKEDNISKVNRLTFETLPNLKSLEFLQRHDLMNDNKITPLGLTVVLSHKLHISIFSVFILSQLYHYQMLIKKNMVYPYLTLEQWFESFPSVSTVCRNVYDMKQKGILDNNLRYRLARINIDKLDDLKRYDKYLQQISQYVNDVSIKIDNLISSDPQVINHRNKNSKLFIGMNVV